MVFRLLKRGVRRMQLFGALEDYDAFLRVVEDTLRVAPTRIDACPLSPAQGKEEMARWMITNC